MPAGLTPARTHVDRYEQRPLEPGSLHEVGQRLADHRLEHAVEMEGREPRSASDIREPQPRPSRVPTLSEMGHDVVDREVDAFDVGRWGVRGGSSGSGFWGRSQVLRPFCRYGAVT